MMWECENKHLFFKLVCCILSEVRRDDCYRFYFSCVAVNTTVTPSYHVWHVKVNCCVQASPRPRNSKFIHELVRNIYRARELIDSWIVCFPLRPSVWRTFCAHALLLYFIRDALSHTMHYPHKAHTADSFFSLSLPLSHYTNTLSHTHTEKYTFRITSRDRASVSDKWAVTLSD